MGSSYSLEDVLCRFDAAHFAQGRFRLAYKGRYGTRSTKCGRQCVVKKMKDTFYWKPTDWNETLSILETSKQLASGFNSYSNTNRPVKFADVEVGTVSDVGDSTSVRLNEYITLEEFIPGKYIKWCNNYGRINTDSTAMPGFVHWSWAHTKGETMIADLQGVREDDAYYLTDPCLLSATSDGGKYGCTDMGIEGMAMFFINHNCTDFCKNIPKPGVRGVSREQIAAALRVQQQISTSTAYSHEVTFPRHIRDALIPVFKQIACTANV